MTLLAAISLAQATTTTVVVPRVVGEPLPSWVVLAASALLFALIILGGVLVNRRRRAEGDIP